MMELSRRDWAWEFLRRNPAFRTALAKLENAITARRIDAHATLYELPNREGPLAD